MANSIKGLNPFNSLNPQFALWNYEKNAQIASGVVVPGQPANLAATPGDGEVVLEWDDTATATRYNVKRSEVEGGPYTVIASPSVSNYTDTDVVNDTEYFYVVSAVNAQGQGPDSAEEAATPTA